MNKQISKADVQLIRSEVERFVRGSIAPLVERPEIALPTASLMKLTQHAIETGLLSLQEPSGAGIWEQGAEPPLLSIEMLSITAEINAGVALHFHQIALARYLLEALSLPCDLAADTALCISGYYGLGRSSLPRYLSNKEVEREDMDFLDEWLKGDNSAPFVFTAAKGWKNLLHPTVDQQGNITFSVYAREDIPVSEMANSHGFDELSGFCCQGFAAVDSVASSSLSSEQCRDLYATVLQINSLGLMAIALGSVRHSYSLAVEYAAIREQGGTVINKHAAVKLLLGKLRSAIDNSMITLEYLGTKSLSMETLPRVFSIRSTLHKELCDAANAAMQTFGGIGYMCDIGIEKIVRDCNSLRVTDGTPTELTLFVAEWERLHG